MLKLTSDPKNICEVEPFVKGLASQFKINEEKYPNILISVTEAVNNAIVHGNQNDKTKFVDIFLKETSDGLAIRVKDEGSGFNYSNIPDPTLPENIENLGGRGVFLIQQLCDEVEFFDNGRVVEMHFSLT